MTVRASDFALRNLRDDDVELGAFTDEICNVTELMPDDVIEIQHDQI